MHWLEAVAIKRPETLSTMLGSIPKMKIPHIAPLLKYGLYRVICDNKANSAGVELGLGLRLASYGLTHHGICLTGLLLHIRAAHTLHCDQLMMSVSGQFIADAAHQCIGRFWPF